MSPASVVSFRTRFAIVCAFVFALAIGLVPVLSSAQNSGHHHDHSSMSMPMEDHPDPAIEAKLRADRKESEFNHHLAGIFVVLAGLFILTGEKLKNRWPAIKYAWPL